MKKNSQIIEDGDNRQLPPTQGIINKNGELLFNQFQARHVILTTSNTGNVIIVPKLPSLERDWRI